MSYRSGIRVALRALAKNKLQTSLTVIGLTIGVATVLTMLALGSGAQAAIEDQVRAAGMNLIVVTAGNYKAKTEEHLGVVDSARLASKSPFQNAVWSSGAEPERPSSGPESAGRPAATGSVAPLPERERVSPFVLVFHPEDDPLVKHDHPTARQRLGDLEAGLGSAATLTSGDAAEIRGLVGVQYVSEGVHENAHVSFGGKRWFTRLHGDDVSLPLIRRAWTFEHGRFYTRREEANADQVMVLGSIVARKLFGDRNPAGEIVSVWNQPFKVIGVVGSGSWMVAPAPGDDQFDAVYVPYTTVHRLLNLSKLNDITVTAKSTGDVTRVSKSILVLLRLRHRIGPEKPDDFTVTTQAREALARGGLRPEVVRSIKANVSVLEKVTLDQLGKTLDRASRTMTVLLACVAAVSLLVGGIGIMNIMLLSVTGRTREIGMRRAVGARARDVLLQFLMEAILLSLAGGVAGIVAGVAASLLISRVVSWSAIVSPAAIAISFGLAAIVGISFGYYPARQASRIAPIDSLRWE